MDRETVSDDANSAVGPALIMLVPDAYGVASYRLHTYHDVEPAEAYLKLWFSKAADTGVIPFWAFTEQPGAAPDADIELMVLVQDADRQGVVYPFSFVEFDSAQAFARQQVAKGLGEESVLIYWAVSVRIETDDMGALQLSPSSPPAHLHPEVDVLLATPSAGVQSVIAGTPDATPAIERDFFTEFSAPHAATEFTSPAKEVGMKKPTKGILDEDFEVDKDIPVELGGSAGTNNSNRHDQLTKELEKELLKLRQARRWEPQEGPFRGINSPPGRF